jgi:TRAP transporter 4TM/12TM fusion protein
MGMINGTSAGNVVATGSLTIPLMKKVGYPAKSAAAIEATASSGGQILPPIMGAGAFIMAEVTGIPYTDIVVAAIIPALLYFVSVYFMIDLQATKLGMKGLPKSELPKFRVLAKQVFLFLPIIILIYTLFAGYSVIRAGTVAMASAAVVSWLTPYRMGPVAVLKALELGAKMSIQLVAVCAAAGIIVGVIALTGVGARFSSLLLGIAEQNQLVALFFAMCISIILGMGMPTTAAYAVAAAVVAPGLIQLGIPVLVAHFFVFYYAVMSAITPPVALAAYAGAGLSGSDPMKTSVEAFKIGLAAFIVPFMFFYSHELLMQGEWIDIARVVATALLGMYLLSASVQGYYFGRVGLILRAVLLIAALSMIEGTWYTDLFGLAVAVGLFFYQKRFVTPQTLAKGAD